MPVNDNPPSRSDRLAKATGAGALFLVAVWSTIHNPPEGAGFFLMPLTIYWPELRGAIRRARRRRNGQSRTTG
jgi:hypothetical protein